MRVGAGAVPCNGSYSDRKLISKLVLLFVYYKKELVRCFVFHEYDSELENRERAGQRGRLWNKTVSDWISWQKENDPQDKTEPIMVLRENSGGWLVRLASRTWEEMAHRHNRVGFVCYPNRTVTIPWSDFAAAMDKIYPVKE